MALTGAHLPAPAPRPLVALVDAYGTGGFLRDACLTLGADVVHVSSTAEPLPALKPPDLSGYRALLVCADPVRTARELAELDAVAVIAGQEPGVPLADTLSEMLDLPTNGSALSAARRDKYAMIEAVGKVGLRCAEQFKSDDVASVVAWARRQGGRPVVVKPLAGSGSQGMAICADLAQVRRAATAILGTTTMYAQANTEVLVQSYLDGPEYVVDTVSCEGRTYVSAVWRDEKRRSGTHNVHHLKVLMAPDDPVVAELTSYVGEVLDALGIRHGAAHAEVIRTADGPALVELGARMNGTMRPGFDDVCCGANQARVSALAYLRPRQFHARYADRTYQRHREALRYYGSTDLDGTVARHDPVALAEMRAVESVWEVVTKVDPGGRIRPTVDLPTSPLTVHMAHENGADLLRDYHRVREIAKRVYHLENAEREVIISS